jgi:pyridoxamine 5'-phosphate oxidase
MTLADVRREYLGEPLDETHCDADPFAQFSIWLQQVQELEADPTAMVLGTATKDGHPSTRVVLLKAFDTRGFVFFTNYSSRKAREMAETGRASLLFFWRSVNRQVRIGGTVERVTAEESDAYFATRPLDSRLSVYASNQSEVLGSREMLDQRFDTARERFADGHVPRPDWWGGYRVVPDEIEFWQGRLSRMHDRLQYRRQANGSWVRERLAP